MEALSAGIPVIATDVGGTAEFVDDTVGRILPADLSAELLATSLESIYRLGENDKLEIRRRAFQRYVEKCDAVKLASEMAELLSK
jgi:glycosyltransferase involved in cell wall biosynthesis